jgi:predicted transcriptional regulator of viral defense system
MKKTKRSIRADRLYAIAESQGGYFTSTDAKSAGYDYPLQHFHARRGTWVRVDHGVYRLKRFPRGDHEDLIQWWLWSRKKGAISGQSAAAVYGMGEVYPSSIHLMVPQGFRRRTPKGVVLHKASLAQKEVEMREGFRITTPLRTVLDLARDRLDPEKLRGVVRDALSKGLLDGRELLSSLAKMSATIDPQAQVAIHLAIEQKVGATPAAVGH